MSSHKYLIVICAWTWNAAIVELNDEQLKTVLAVCRVLNNGSLNEAPCIRLHPISSVEEMLDRDEATDDECYLLYARYNDDFIKIKYNPFKMENLL